MIINKTVHVTAYYITQTIQYGRLYYAITYDDGTIQEYTRDITTTAAGIIMRKLEKLYGVTTNVQTNQLDAAIFTKSARWSAYFGVR